MSSKNTLLLPGSVDLGKKRIVFVSSSESGLGTSTFVAFVYGWYRLVAGIEPTCLDLNWENPSLAKLLPGVVVDDCKDLHKTSTRFWEDSEHGGFSALALLDKIRDLPGELFLVDLPVSMVSSGFRGFEFLLESEIRSRDFVIYYPWLEIGFLQIKKKRDFNGNDNYYRWEGFLKKDSLSFPTFYVGSHDSTGYSENSFSIPTIPEEVLPFLPFLVLALAPFSFNQFGLVVDTFLSRMNVGCESNAVLLEARRGALANWRCALFKDLLLTGTLADTLDGFFLSITKRAHSLLVPEAVLERITSMDEDLFGRSHFLSWRSHSFFRYFPDLDSPLLGWQQVVPVASVVAKLSPAFAEFLEARQAIPVEEVAIEV